MCRGDINVSSIQGTYSWPEAEPGQSVSQKCQYGGADQNITRFCNGNLTWIEDASKCPTVLSVKVDQLNMLVENVSKEAYLFHFSICFFIFKSSCELFFFFHCFFLRHPSQ